MSVTTVSSEDADMAVKSAVRTTVVVGDDATIHVDHFTDHPTIGCYQVSLGGATLYLTEDSAKLFVSRLARAIAAARESAVSP